MEQQCNRYAYPSKKAAKRHLKEISKKEQKHKKPERTYDCEFCGFWHLTSSPSRKYETFENATWLD